MMTFEQSKHDQEHRERLAMLAAEQSAVERLGESYRALGQAAREAREAMDSVAEAA